MTTNDANQHASAPGENPPKLHWAILLLLTIVTLGIFYIIWMFVQSRWVRRINPESNATSLLLIDVILSVVGEIVMDTSDKGSGTAVAGALLILAGTVVGVFGFFSMRRSMLDHYNRQQPGSLGLSPALTFFLGSFYLQYQMTRIAKQGR